MKFVLPSIEYKQRAVEYINEFLVNDSQINGTGGLDWYLENSTYEHWLEKIRTDMDIANVAPERVPALTYFYIRKSDNMIIGMANLRLALNDTLRTEGGHIGYSVRPTERGKHYATDMLKNALKVYDKLGIQNIILVCDKENIASAKVIKHCGGVLENEFYSEKYGEYLQKYIIKI